MILGLFAGYTKEQTLTPIEEQFKQRYGYAPAVIHDAGSIWLVGPLRDNGRQTKADPALPGPAAGWMGCATELRIDPP